MYHVTFMNQLLILLRAKCEFCGHLKLNPVETSRFTCKLRLIHHGMLKESQQLDDILSAATTNPSPMENGTAVEEDNEEDNEEADSQEKMRAFTKRAIRANRQDLRRNSIAGKTEAIAEERRAVVANFLAAIRKTKICGQCKGCVWLSSFSYTAVH